MVEQFKIGRLLFAICLFPKNSQFSSRHGTRCAGIIAGAADNGYCGVGVAYDANIAGLFLFTK